MKADELDQTPAARACLEELRKVTGEPGGAMERHCLRVFLIAERMAADRAGGREIDRELLQCAAWLHDAGLWSRSEDAYVTEGALLAARVLQPFGWPAERLQRCMDAIEQHHALASQEELGLEVELVRRSDLIEVTAGLVAFDAPRPWLRGLFRAVPRTGLWRMLSGVIGRELRERPLALASIVRPERTRVEQGGQRE